VKLGVILPLFVALVACNGCEPPTKPVTPERWQDEAETPEELAASPDACHRAGVHLHDLGCSSWRPDWDSFCHAMVDAKVPICAVKLSRVKSCDEADEVCR
jgi:hypothetical protein